MLNTCVVAKQSPPWGEFVALLVEGRRPRRVGWIVREVMGDREEQDGRNRIYVEDF